MKISVEYIAVPQRARDVVEDVDFQELVHSIKAHGLLSPLTVRKMARDEFSLICGARRLEAVKQLGEKTVEANVIKVTDALEHDICELEENLRRKDFTWQEDVLACGRLFERLHENDMSYTAVQFAVLMQRSEGKVSMDLDLYEYRMDYPTIFAMSEVSRAREELRRLKVSTLAEERVRRMAEGARQVLGKEPDRKQEAASGTDWTQEIEDIKAVSPTQLVYPDAMSLLEALPDDSIDIICTDPPFGINVEGGRHKRTQRSIYDPNYGDSKEEFFSIFAPCVFHFARVLKPGAHFYIFFGIEHLQEMFDTLRSVGLIPHKVPLIWHRTGVGSAANQPYYYPASSYQAIMFGYAPGERRRLRKQGESNVITLSAVPSQQKVHPLEISQFVYSDLIGRSSSPGDVMIDPFCGVGNSLVAGLTNYCKVLGAEIREDYRALAVLNVKRRLDFELSLAEQSKRRADGK